MENLENIKHEELYEIVLKEEKRPLKKAILIAVIIHLIIFIVKLPQLTKKNDNIVYTITNIKRLAPPAKKLGGPKKSEPIRKVVKKASPKKIPISMPVPDLTPDQPEPVYEETKETLPDVVNQISDNIDLGEVEGPPGGGGGGPLTGEGGGSGGNGVYRIGGGITPPVLVHKEDPKYTDAAIKNRITGVVLLYGIVRKNGRVDSLKVIKGLGYGLDEEAIKTVQTKWKFKPALKDGKPVDCYITIEVDFTIY